MATLGDPLMDLGGALAFWIQADDSDELKMTKRVPTDLPGMITRDEFVQAYCERMGFDLTPEQWRFYEVFGLFRIAVIAQQIYYRYFHGQTTQRDVRPLRSRRADPRPPAHRGRRPAARQRPRVSRILLVRHGQASFGAADYDQLSPTGHEQSRVLGAALAARGVHRRRAS